MTQFKKFSYDVEKLWIDAIHTICKFKKFDYTTIDKVWRNIDKLKIYAIRNLYGFNNPLSWANLITFW